MPPSGPQDTAQAGSASRKRTHAQITRSQSRSITPPSSKRRRLERPNLSLSYSPSPPPQNSIPTLPHFVGDGFDHRRPTTLAMDQAQEQTTIDLTQDDESDNDGSHVSTGSFLNSTVQSVSSSRAASVHAFSRTEDSTHDVAIPRASSPFYQNRNDREIIDLSSSETEEEDEVQFISERQVPRRPVLPTPGEIERRLRTPPPELRRSNAQTFADTLRQLPGFFGLRSAGGVHMGPFAGLGVFDHARAVLQSRVPEPLNMAMYDDVDGLTDYDNINMDYGAAAFVLEDPGLEDTPPRHGDDYKPLSAVPEGYTRDISEGDDVLVCVACEEELATGQDDVKQQVWVSKKCGHVYCGSCASRRSAYRKGNDRDRKKAKQRKMDDLKECKVEGCNTKLTGKMAMFQVYL